MYVLTALNFHMYSASYIQSERKLPKHHLKKWRSPKNKTLQVAYVISATHAT